MRSSCFLDAVSPGRCVPYCRRWAGRHWRLADQVLERLARNDARYLDEDDWFAALELRGSSYAARVLLEFMSAGTFGGRKENAGPLFLARKLAVGMTEDETVRRGVYERYERDPSGTAGSVLEYAIAEAPDDDGILVLIRAYAAQGRRKLDALEPAIRHLAVGQQALRDVSGRRRTIQH